MTKEQVKSKADKMLLISEWLERKGRMRESYLYRDSAHALLKRHGLPYWQTAKDIKRRKATL